LGLNVPPKSLESSAIHTIERYLQDIFGQEFWLHTMKPALTKSNAIITGSWPFQILTNRNFLRDDKEHPPDLDIFVYLTHAERADFKPMTIKNESTSLYVSPIEEALWKAESQFRYDARRTPGQSSSYCTIQEDSIYSVREYRILDESRHVCTNKIQIIQILARTDSQIDKQKELTHWVSQFDFDFCKCVYAPGENISRFCFPPSGIHDMIQGQSEFRITSSVEVCAKRLLKYKKRNIHFRFDHSKLYDDLKDHLCQRKLKASGLLLIEASSWTSENIGTAKQKQIKHCVTACWAKTNVNQLFFHDDIKVNDEQKELGRRAFSLDILPHLEFLLHHHNRFGKVSNDTIQINNAKEIPTRSCFDKICVFNFLSKQHIHFNAGCDAVVILSHQPSSSGDKREATEEKEQQQPEPKRQRLH